MDKFSKTAVILGVDGQDGSYLAKFLLSKGYCVIGWVPDLANINWINLKSIRDQIRCVEGSLLESENLATLFSQYKPDEVYNLASPSFVGDSWRMAEVIGEVSGLGVLRLLESLRKSSPGTRFFQASSSEVFGDPLETPQNENTRCNPRNPYGIAKTYAQQITSAYRQQFQMFAVSGILYNHESPKRPLHFVTRKITSGAVRIALGKSSSLILGDLDARRDWSFAGDVIQAMWMMLQSQNPEDFVIGSGITHSVRDVCEIAFGHLGLDYLRFVETDPEFIRPRERKQLCADPSAINSQLGWQNQRSFEALIRLMVDEDMALLSATTAG